MDIIESADVVNIINKYPKNIQVKLNILRNLIFRTAQEIEQITRLEETLKWGEPSYTTTNGSTIRIAWKENKPDQYAMYFHCKTKLIDTFKERYRNTFKFEGNRAIIFTKTENIATEELKHCIKLSLTYHSIKHLPMLGI